MFRHKSIALLGIVWIAGCVAAALAGDNEDRLILKSGAVMSGTILETRNGQYWMELEDGRVVGVAFEEVDRVEKATQSGDRSPPTEYGDSRLEEDHRGTSKSDKGPVGGGFDIGLLSGGRVRFRSSSRAVAHIDLRLAAGIGLLSGSVYPVVLFAPELAFFNPSPVHLTVAPVLGAVVSSGLYPMFGAGGGVQFEVGSGGHIDLGLIGASYSSSPLIIPQASFGWVW